MYKCLELKFIDRRTDHLLGIVVLYRLLGKSMFISLSQNNDILVTGKWPHMCSN